MSARTRFVLPLLAAATLAAALAGCSNNASSAGSSTSTSSAGFAGGAGRTTTTSSASTPTTGSPSGGGSTSPVAAITQQQADARAVAAGCPSSPSTQLHKPSWSSAPPLTVDKSKHDKATVVTDVGTFVIALDVGQAPQTVNSFVFLAQHHFFDCIIFHRVIPTFMDQTGDPTGSGSGGPGYTLPDENPAPVSGGAPQYPIGSVAMANTGEPHSGGSQFFIVTGNEGETLPPTYALFGMVTSGIGVIERINADGSQQGVPPTITHRMLKVTISES